MLPCLPPELKRKDVRGGDVVLPRELDDVTPDEVESLDGLLVWGGSLPYFRPSLAFEEWQPEELVRILGLLDRVHVALARLDPAAFVQYALRHERDELVEIRNGQHHEEWHRFFDEHEIAVLFAPVEHAKTQQIAIGRALWMIGKNPSLTAAIVSDTEDQAAKIGRTIRAHITSNPRVHRVFPTLLPSNLPTDPWNDSAFTVARTNLSAKDPTVQVVGVGGAINGARLDLVILDDALDLRNTANEPQIKKVLEWIDTTLFTRIRDGGVLWWIGTPWKPQDPMHTVAARPGVAVARYSAVLNPDETDRTKWIPLWPEQWSLARLLKVWARTTPIVFARKYLCRVRSDENARFASVWIESAYALGRGYDFEPRVPVVDGQLVGCFTGVDLGVGKRAKNGRTAIVTLAQHGGRARVVSVRSGHWRAPEIVQLIRDETYRFRSFAYVENNAAQDFLLQFALEGADPLPVVGWTTGANKHDEQFGVESLAVEMRNGLFVFPSGEGTPPDEMQGLTNDLLFYDPQVHTPDRVMALWLARQAMRFGAAAGGGNGKGSWAHDLLSR